MTYTSHGHHIDGTIKDRIEPYRVARCGGPGMCPVCKREAASVLLQGIEDPMNPSDPQDLTDPQGVARGMVLSHFNGNYLDPELGTADARTIEQVLVVWFSKTLQNWKALLVVNHKETNAVTDYYYELIHNGDRKETYLNAYIKLDSAVIPD